MAVEALSELMHVVDYHWTSSAAESGALPHAHGADGRGNTAMVTARELILKEAARRAGSPWAWERELAFLIVEAFAKRVGHKGADDRSLSLRYDRVLVFPPAVRNRRGMEGRRLRSAETDRLLRDSVCDRSQQSNAAPHKSVVIDTIPGKSLCIETQDGTMPA